MKVVVDELLPASGTARTLPFDERVESQTEDVAFPAPVTGQVTLTHLGETLDLRGTVTTTVTLVCGKCLRPFEHSLAASITEQFWMAPPERPVGQEVALTEEDFVFPLGEGKTLDLTEVVRQHLLLELPMVPQCSEDCRGLCPRCGANLNTGPCGCAGREIDPRLAALQRLRSDST
ncbi:MAG: DUF177 domain-containing protein [Armatimonadetes bacterium]|nr:DUF177 domain-containing protein [Armatimonadota bacterium]